MIVINNLPSKCCSFETNSKILKIYRVAYILQILYKLSYIDIN